MHILLSHRYSGRIIRDVIRRLTRTTRNFSNKKSDDIIEIPPEPTTCCMSGCQNCVWIAYAEDLAKLYKGNSEKAREIILEKISDPNLKMFLSIELKYINQRTDNEKEEK